MSLNAPVPVRLSESTDERLSSISARSGLSKAELIRLAVDNYMTQVERTGEIVQRIVIQESGRSGDNHFTSGSAAPARTAVNYKQKRAAKKKGEK